MVSKTEPSIEKFRTETPDKNQAELSTTLLMKDSDKSGQLVCHFRELWTAFAKAVKATLLYPPDNPLPQQFRKAILYKLATLFDQTTSGGVFTFSITSKEIFFHNHQVYIDSSSQGNIAGIFHRDGLRSLTFHSGFSGKECDWFIDAVSSIVANPSDDADLVTSLWEKDFSHLTYQVVDETAESIFNRIETEPKPEINLDPLFYSNIVKCESEETPAAERTGLPDGSGAPPLLPDEHLNEIRRVMGEIEQTARMDESVIREQLQLNQVFPWRQEVLELVGELFYQETDLASASEIISIVEKIHEELVLETDFQHAIKLISTCRRLITDFRQTRPEWAKKLRVALERFGDQLRIGQINELLNANKVSNLESLEHYLTALELNSIGNIVQLLATLQYYPHRKMICRVLETVGAGAVDTVGKGMFHDLWYVRRNTALILGKIGGAKATEYLKAGITHTDPRVRKESLLALASVGSPRACEIAQTALTDTDPKLRLLALHIIADHPDGHTAPKLWNQVFAKGFADRSPEEQREIFLTLAKFEPAAVEPQLIKLATRHTWFWRSRFLPLRLLAIEALGKLGTTLARTVLENLTRSRNRRIREASLRSLNFLKLNMSTPAGEMPLSTVTGPELLHNQESPQHLECSNQSADQFSNLSGKDYSGETKQILSEPLDLSRANQFLNSAQDRPVGGEPDKSTESV